MPVFQRRRADGAVRAGILGVLALMVLGLGMWASEWREPSTGLMPESHIKPLDAASVAPRSAGAAPSASTQVAAIQRQVAEAGARAPASTGAPMLVQGMAERVKANPAEVQQTMAGKRVSVAGRLASVEKGQEGVTMVSLAVDGQSQGLRLILDPAGAANVDKILAGDSVHADCLSQGVLMGEWLLVDCRL